MVYHHIGKGTILDLKIYTNNKHSFEYSRILLSIHCTFVNTPEVNTYRTMVLIPGRNHKSCDGRMTRCCDCCDYCDLILVEQANGLGMLKRTGWFGNTLSIISFFPFLFSTEWIVFLVLVAGVFKIFISMSSMVVGSGHFFVHTLL